MLLPIRNGVPRLMGGETRRLDIMQLLINTRAVGDITSGSGFENTIMIAKKNQDFEIFKLLEAQGS